MTEEAKSSVPFQPRSTFVEDLLSCRSMEQYGFDKPILEALAAVEGGASTRRALLGELLALLPQRIASEALPESVVALLRHDTWRIGTALNTEPDTFYDTGNDAFLKDLAILLLNLLPCGAEYVQVRAGVPRSVLWRSGLMNVFRSLHFFVFRARGFAPYLSLHMDVRSRNAFNPEGWQSTYLRIADLLRLRPALKGVFGTAWFYDPAMAWVSPHLAYLREEREAAGAMTFRYGPSESALRNALATSETRRRLYAEGRYLPMSYYIVWPRDELLRWADAQQPAGGDDR